MFRQLKARAALRGMTMKAFVLQAIRDKLEAELAERVSEPGWQGVYGKASGKEIDQVQDIIDSEFSQINPEDWE